MTRHSASSTQRSNKVAVAMSGGVDSSVAAYLLAEAGHDCLGLTMRLASRLAGREEIRERLVHAESTKDVMELFEEEEKDFPQI